MKGIYVIVEISLEICRLKLQDWKGFQSQRMCKNDLRLPAATRSLRIQEVQCTPC